MSLSSVSINRPVLAIVLSILIIVFGGIALSFLGIREFPAVDPPVVTVSTSYTGANADVIENQITEPLEESINGIAGINTLTSVSSEGNSQITVEFTLDVALEDAANDVRDRVSRAMRNLPPDADSPVVAKADANQTPIIMILVQSDTRNLMGLSDIANNIFKERFQTVPGVSEVRIWGEKRYSMRLWLNPVKMTAYGITPLDVRSALQRENVELPSGRIEGDATELTVRTMGRLTTAEDFNNMIVRESNGRLIRMSDIGQAILGPEDQRSIMKRDGVPMVSVVVQPQPGSNNIAISDEVQKRLEQIRTILPSDVRASVFYDATKYIRRSIKEVEETIVVAFILVLLIIYLFLRDWRATIIPILAIPVSLIGTFFLLFSAGFSVNVLTLLGIVLAIGLVVDDAIVVLENIYKKIEDGMDPVDAGHKGSREIFFAVISTTITLAAVFLPIVFLQGLTGRLFREFGVTVAGAVLISAFVALTLTPMLTTRLIKSHQRHSWFYQFTEPFFVWLNQAYVGSLAWFMERRWLGLALMVVAIAAIVGIGRQLNSELAPLEDRGRLRISATAQEGATFEFMESYMSGLTDAVARGVAERDATMTMVGMGGANSGFITVMLVDRKDRSRSQQQIFNSLQPMIRTFTGARAFVTQDQTIGSSRRGGLPVQFVLQAPDFERLREKLPVFLAEAEKDPTFSIVDVNLKFNKPELRVNIDRERAKALGISVMDIAQTLQLALSGQRFGFFVRESKQYQVIGQVERQDRDKPLDLKSLTVRATNGQLIQLDNIVTLTEESAPPSRYRFNRYVAATVSAGLAPGRTLGEGIDAMRRIAGRTLDDSFSTALQGTSRDFAESSSSLLFSFIFALVLIYLVLAAQFESFRDPFTILLTVPLALLGAILSLWIFGQTLNLFSQIGIIMLIGLVTKNGILIVEFANQRKDSGLGLFEAVQDAAAQRFRPILMTSMSTILGTLPIALALGEGAESRVSMGIAVVGGLIFSTFLTLYLIPAMYTYISTEHKRISEDEGERVEAADDPVAATTMGK